MGIHQLVVFALTPGGDGSVIRRPGTCTLLPENAMAADLVVTHGILEEKDLSRIPRRQIGLEVRIDFPMFFMQSLLALEKNE